jgi:hypothetical protein
MELEIGKVKNKNKNKYIYYIKIYNISKKELKKEVYSIYIIV